MITGRFLMGRQRGALSGEEKQAIEDTMSEVRSYPARQDVVCRNEQVDFSTYLIEGYMCRYMDDRRGYRQLVAVHVPGDFVDLHAFPMKRLDHDVATLGPVKIAIFPHEALATLCERLPRVARMLWFSTLLDAAMHREWIFRLGRLGAEGRLAHFFCELAVRLRFVGLNDDGRFALPLVQADIAEACGITSVHANRVLRQLRETGLMTFKNGQVALLDEPALRRMAEFDEQYLYGSDETRGQPRPAEENNDAQAAT
jgi:CRP-like cAMP-binding protein